LLSNLASSWTEPRVPWKQRPRIVGSSGTAALITAVVLTRLVFEAFEILLLIESGRSCVPSGHRQGTPWSRRYGPVTGPPRSGSPAASRAQLNDPFGGVGLVGDAVRAGNPGDQGEPFGHGQDIQRQQPGLVQGGQPLPGW
jgi:hypothetical protein